MDGGDDGNRKQKRAGEAEERWIAKNVEKMRSIKLVGPIVNHTRTGNLHDQIHRKWSMPGG